jgi:DNA-binding FrmR family transcriptional regulator
MRTSRRKIDDQSDESFSEQDVTVTGDALDAFIDLLIIKSTITRDDIMKGVETLANDGHDKVLVSMISLVRLSDSVERTAHITACVTAAAEAFDGSMKDILRSGLEEFLKRHSALNDTAAQHLAQIEEEIKRQSIVAKIIAEIAGVDDVARRLQ